MAWWRMKTDIPPCLDWAVETNDQMASWASCSSSSRCWWQVEAMEIAVLQQLPQTISGFACEVVLLSPRFQAADVDFVLPRFALAGCDDAVAEASRTRALPAAALGVKVTVEMPSSGEKRTTVLTSRQVATMKRFHTLRQHVTDTATSLAWIDAVQYPPRRPAAPFDDLFDYPKVQLLLSSRAPNVVKH